ncbi:MAG TPA: peptidoglycan-binding domain-containing protein [Stellaceae bacterium]
MRFGLSAAAAGLALCLAVLSPAFAAATDDQFKSDIEGFLNKLSTTTHGIVSWEGSDSFEMRREGDAAVATITNARLTLHEAKPAELVFDHIEIRRIPVAGTPSAAKYDITFPTQSTLTLADGTKTSLSLKDAKASLTLEEGSNRFSETLASFAGARLEHASTGDWVSFGPLSISSKLAGAADGGWSNPIDFELKQIEFFLSEVPVGGAIDRIAYTALSSGPDVAGLNRLRARMDELREQGEQGTTARADAFLELLPTLPALFSLVKGETTLEGLAVRAANGEALVGLAKASLGGALTGLSGDTAAWRITIRHNGLTLASSILDPAKVPQNIVVDFGLENVATGPLRTILEAIAKARKEGDGADSQQGMQRMIGAAAMLNPIFRIYEAGLKTKDVGLAATAEAKGSPLSPKGYSAEADVVVRGFDALPALLGDSPYAQYLPLLKVLGTAGADSDVKFHLASAPPKWITINGNDVSDWLIGSASEPGKPRQLRPAEPPLQGDDVRAVQRALNSAKIAAPQSGTYDGATAAAVAQFQKQNGLNVDGVVTEATRDKLGVKLPAQQPPPAPEVIKPPRR